MDNDKGVGTSPTQSVRSAKTLALSKKYKNEYGCTQFANTNFILHYVKCPFGMNLKPKAGNFNVLVNLQEQNVKELRDYQSKLQELLGTKDKLFNVKESVYWRNDISGQPDSLVVVACKSINVKIPKNEYYVTPPDLFEKGDIATIECSVSIFHSIQGKRFVNLNFCSIRCII